MFFKLTQAQMHRGRWTREEDIKIKIGYQFFGPNWKRISDLFQGSNNGGRSEIQVRERYVNVLSKPVIKWSAEQDQKLIALVQNQKEGKKLNWKLIAMKMGKGFQNKMCLCRYRKLTYVKKYYKARPKVFNAA